jgi:hypothetical protein
MDENIENGENVRENKNNKKRAREQEDANVKEMVANTSEHHFDTTLDMATLLAHLFGIQDVLKVIIASMALPSHITDIVEATGHVDPTEIVAKLAHFTKGEHAIYVSKNSIYAVFIAFIIKFIMMAARRAGWKWSVPEIGLTNFDVEVISTDTKILIDVFEQIQQHKKVQILVEDGSKINVAKLRKPGFASAFRQLTILEWQNNLSITLMIVIAKRENKSTALELFVSSSKIQIGESIVRVAKCQQDKKKITQDMYNLLNQLDYTDPNYHFAIHIIKLFAHTPALYNRPW